MRLKTFFLLLLVAVCISFYSQAQFTPIPYFTNFDSGASGWTGIPSTVGNTEWQIGTPAFGTTNSAYSAPNAWDLNLSTAYEANAECYLLSPFFDFNGKPSTVLSFWQNRNVQNNWDGTHLEYTLDSGLTWQVLGAVGSTGATNWYNNSSIVASGLPAWTGQSGGQIGSSIWQKSSIPLPDFSTNPLPVQFRFVFNSSSAIQFDGMSIDDFEIEVNTSIDIGLTNLFYTINSIAGDTIPLFVQLTNFGTAFNDSVEICFNINGGNLSCVNWLVNVAAGASTPFIFAGNIIVPPGSSNICVWINVAGDSNSYNDLQCGPLNGENVIAVGFGNDFCDNFDSTNIGWITDNAFSQWELGAPNGAAINFAHSSPNAWMILLNANYQNNSNENLYSPSFDFSNAVNAKLSFYNWIHSEAQWDGGRIDYSTDNGITWQVLGGVNDPKGTNWYNNNNLISTALPGWDGLSSSWVKSEYLLDQFNNFPVPVKFRFNFSSDAAVNSFDGWAIDDFKIEMPVAINAQTNNISAGGPIILPGLRPIKANIINAGTLDLTDVDITLEIDGNVIVTNSRSFSPPLSTGSFMTHTFSVPWNAVNGCEDMRVWTSNPNNTTDIINIDDTSSATFCVFETIDTFPYCNDFESGNPWTTYNSKNLNSANSWQLGTPAQANINSAFSGTNAWMTNLNQDYPNEDASVLLTPGFDVQQGKCYKFSFEGNFITENILDGGSIDYSYDDGATWTTLGDTSDANWYNTYNVFSFASFIPKGGWTGNSNGWQHYENFHVANSTDIVIFRFWFVSDLTIIDEGWAIDDFCLEEVSGTCATSVYELNPINLQSIFPNPTSGITQINFELNKTENISLHVTDMLGKSIMLNKESTFTPVKHSIEINTNEWSEGIYFISLSTEEHSITKKLIVVK